MRITISTVLAVLLLISPNLAAHHSHGNYDLTKYTFLEGTVTEIHWINPHSWIYIQVVGADGQPVSWALEGANVTRLERIGWTREDVKVGDTISARCHQLRDGANGCLLGYVTPEGGVETVFD